jgi:hypothetical protein
VELVESIRRCGRLGIPRAWPRDCRRFGDLFVTHIPPLYSITASK